MKHRKGGHRAKKNFVIGKYGFSGVFFTITGPLLFWLLYPIGIYYALILTEAMVHVTRYLIYKYLVFTAKEGFEVNPKSYIISILPVVMANFWVATLFRNVLNRTGLALLSGCIAIFLGYALSISVYSKTK